MAGNASNWYKVTDGPLKGQVVYVENRQTFGRMAARAKITKRAFVMQLLVNGSLPVSKAPAGAAKRGGAIKALAPQASTPTPRAQPMNAIAAGKLYAQAEGRAVNAGRSNGQGDPRLALIYAAQGYNAKPDVMPKEQIDAFVKAGEIEVFRGTVGPAGYTDAWNEVYRSGAVHYPGWGISGNGSYTATNIQVAANYAGDNTEGTILRMTIKADARIVSYATIQAERVQALADALATPQAQRYQAGILTFKQRMANANTSAEYRDAQARMVRLQARYDREVPTTIYNDAGAYAASRGYDAIHVDRSKKSNQGDFYVILNRGATRVQHTSLLPDDYQDPL